MIKFTDRGAGLFDWLAARGVSLAEGFSDGVGVWESNAPAETVLELIDQYNPWPVEKAAKLAEVGAWFIEAADQLIADVPQVERDSWPVQVNEAYGTRPLSMLVGMAEERGITVEALIERVKVKAELYAYNYGRIQGRRDALEDLIKAFPDEGQIERLPDLWGIKC